MYASQKPTYYKRKVRQYRKGNSRRLYTNLLGVRHRDLADEGTNVDEQVEVHVDLRGRHDGVDDDALAASCVADEELRALVLLSDEGRDVGLESTGTETHDDDGDDEAGQSTV